MRWLEAFDRPHPRETYVTCLPLPLIYAVTSLPKPTSKKSKSKAATRRVSTRVRSQNLSAGVVKLGRIVFFPCGDQVCIFLSSLIGVDVTSFAGHAPVQVSAN